MVLALLTLKIPQFPLCANYFCIQNIYILKKSTKFKGVYMEKTTLEEPKEFLSLENRRRLKIDGVVEINSSSETQLNIKLKDTNLSITGTSMHITKLDVDMGILEVDGLINLIKYGKTESLFKRIFK